MPDRTRSGRREKAVGALSWLWASCEKVSFSESKSLDEEQSEWERLMVNAHQRLCPACRRFRKQVRLLDAMLRRIRAWREADDRLPGLFLSSDVRERTKAALRGAKDPGGPVLPRPPID
jgi:predicted anti-sigma-YlaC factor YlaD